MASDREQLVKPGEITALKQQVRNSARTSVFIDGEFAFGVHTDLAVRGGLYVGQQLRESDLNTLQCSEKILRGRSAAMRYLSYAPRTEHQVRQRLTRNGLTKDELDDIIADLYELGYIDDRRYAIEYAEARFKNKGYGPARIRRELVEDGVSSDNVAEAVAAAASTDMYSTSARKIAEKFRDRVEGTLPERKKKLANYLIRRGFGYKLSKEIALEVLNQR
ncbi:MAG: recombinase RecX [Rhodothermaceae bacterium]|nr:recombinase RecX [Rhodothermaceae bacterium]MYF64413.1 recombinase RecX [Rhodothermaceae bacterium]MYI84353.1 recombinase RecX [Rhodothermaceae bacterium]